MGKIPDSALAAYAISGLFCLAAVAGYHMGSNEATILSFLSAVVSFGIAEYLDTWSK